MNALAVVRRLASNDGNPPAKARAYPPLAHRMSREQDPRIRDYILQHVEEFPGSISSRAAKEFGFTRTGISRYINRLVASGLLVASGNTKARRYQLVKDPAREFSSSDPFGGSGVGLAQLTGFRFDQGSGPNPGACATDLKHHRKSV
jgi:hypothetical protein